MAELHKVQIWADALIKLYIPDWTFRFDNAKTRAGACHYQSKEITVSKYLAEKFDDDEIHQVLLHEVAHAMAGSEAAHGARWKKIAKELGYDGKRTHDGPTATEKAKWLGTCPAGHTHHRYRKPQRPLSCKLCANKFDSRNLIIWQSR